jgi:hypothetical protein
LIFWNRWVQQTIDRPVSSSAWLCIQRKSFTSSCVNNEILCFAVDWMGECSCVGFHQCKWGY